MTKSTSQRLARAADDAGRNVRSATDHIAAEVGDLADNVARRSRKVAAKVRKQVKKHPAAAGVIAGAAGAAVALIGLGLVRRMGRA